MLDVVSVGSATEDVFVSVPRANFHSDSCIFYPGTKVDIEGMSYYTGGGATNTAVAFSRLGLKAGIISAIGTDESGSAIVSELRRENVDVRFITRLADRHTSYSVILTGFGRDRVVLCYSSAAAMLSSKIVRGKKARAHWFYVSSLHGDKKLLKKVFSLVHGSGARVAFNPGERELGLGFDKLKQIVGRVDVLLVNSREAMQLTGSVDIHRNLKKLLSLAGIVVISDGANGAHAADGANHYSCGVFHAKVVDVTGAGDAFASGFVAAIIKEQ